MENTTELFEKTYPLIAEEYKKISDEQYALFASKMLSYGIGNIAMGTNLETPEEKHLSLSAIFIRMNDKINRLKNLIWFRKANTVENESLTDTFQDMSVYSIIAQIVIRNKWTK
jgi:hypothetical protein